MMRYGFEQVKSALESTDLNIPPELQGAADSILSGSRDTPTFPLLSWLMDEKKPGATARRWCWPASAAGRSSCASFSATHFADPEDKAGWSSATSPKAWSIGSRAKGNTCSPARR
jgi:hypothetical protein